jgi:AcrR family transcriptional regulator
LDKRIDRRAARSREAIHRAFLALIEARGYDAVTVQQICRKAGVGRATFYTHYASKDDLKVKGILSMQAQLADRVDIGASEFAFSRALFDHAREHLNLHRTMMASRSGQIAHDALRQVIRNLVRNDLTGRGKPASTFAVEYYSGALLSLLTAWLDAGARPEPVEIDRMFRQFATDQHRA